MTKKIEKNWDDMSYYYEAFTRGENSYSQQIEMPCLGRLLPDLKDKKVLDLGCGSGRFAFEFEFAQAQRVVGIDFSQSMLDIAHYKGQELSSKVEFIKGDVACFSEFIDEKFDLIFSSTTLHFIEDLPGVFKQIYQALEEEGTCVLSLIHPVYSSQYPVSDQGHLPEDHAWQVRYLDQRQRAYVQPWIEYNDQVEDYLCTSYHHTFSDYMNAIVMAGLKVDKVSEPGPPEAWLAKGMGRYESYIKTPTYMLLKVSKR